MVQIACKLVQFFMDNIFVLTWFVLLTDCQTAYQNEDSRNACKIGCQSAQPPMQNHDEMLKVIFFIEILPLKEKVSIKISWQTPASR